MLDVTAVLQHVVNGQNASPPAYAVQNADGEYLVGFTRDRLPIWHADPARALKSTREEAVANRNASKETSYGAPCGFGRVVCL